jgi:hypothetical protein
MDKEPSEAIERSEVEEVDDGEEVDEHVALDGGVLNVPVETEEETPEQRLKRVAAAEEHQDAQRAGTRLGKL